MQVSDTSSPVSQQQQQQQQQQQELREPDSDITTTISRQQQGTRPSLMSTTNTHTAGHSKAPGVTWGEGYCHILSTLPAYGQGRNPALERTQLPNKVCY